MILMRPFFIALQFLTRLSIVHQDNWTEEDFGKSVKFFPLVGAVLGLIYAAFIYIFLTLLPAHGVIVPHHFLMAFMLVLPPLMTGGLFCDGFMDTMDGVFSGRERERMLEIMKDSRVGSNAVFSFVVLMIFEYGILLDMDASVLLPAFFVRPVIAMMMMTIGIECYPYARKKGLGKFFSDMANRKSLVFATVMALIFVVPWGRLAWLSYIVCLLFTMFFARFVTKKLGGLTGDVYGAINTLNEGLVMLVFLFGHAAGL